MMDGLATGMNAAMVDCPFFNAIDETSQTDGTFAIVVAN